MSKRKLNKLLADERKQARTTDGTYVDPEFEAWVNSLPSSSLEALISTKQLAAQRAANLPNGSFATGIFNWKTLRGINIILEEFMKHRLAVTCPDLIPGLKATEEEVKEVPQDVKSS